MKLLTVTIPCYNSQDYMEKCIRSLLTGGERVEIIIIDDGSQDATGAIADLYEKNYPTVVKAVHQENGGHGAGINAGLAHATGRYFKVVDSDDWVCPEFPQFLDALEQCDREGGADLIVTNYYYEHADGKGNQSICYANALPQHRIFGWKDIGKFKLRQLLTIHSCTFRTEVMRSNTAPLPEHVFYEDNLMVYQVLPYTQRLYYLNMDLYRYFIGRDGQSVQKDVMTRRYRHQILVAQRCFETCHLDQVAEPKLRAYLSHELFMMFAIAALYARLHNSDEADEELNKMWAACRAYDAKWAARFRDRSSIGLICIPGESGRTFSGAVYRLANKVVRFN